MGYEQFFSTVYCKTIDTSEIVECGTFQSDINFELAYMRIGVYIAGTLSGSEQLRITINDSFSSSWVALTDSNWLGLIRLDFASQNISKNNTYSWKVETNNYTRNGDTFYIGLFHDYPNSTYEITVPTNVFYRYPIKAEIYGNYDNLYNMRVQ